MKASKIHTLWIILLSLLYTAYTCGSATIKSLRRTISRTWCDEELQRWVKRLIKLVRIHYKVINPHHVEPQKGQPTIIMCNHSSLFDIPLSLLAFPHHSIRMLSKKELANIPIMGGGMVAAEFPFIDRNNRRQAIKDLAVVKELLATGIVMWIAPEGTRSKDGKLGAFKKGGFVTAITTGATIIPIGIRGANAILPAQTHRFNINQHAEIHIGKPIDASKFTLATKEDLLNDVHQSIQQLVGEQE
ncbi:MAG: lysophospholipid acyltransferase family protein [Legionellaceae bacterium]|nr:lysophospholipid acyltransferase family protein [Legionellaceae bacterium]